jgi:hypothetical protein
MTLSHQKVLGFCEQNHLHESSPIRNFKKLLWPVTQARVELVDEQKAGITGNEKSADGGH